MGTRRHAPQLADAVEGEGQRAPARSRTRTATSRRRRTSTTSTPTSACRRYHQPYNSTTSFVWSLPFGHGKRWGSGMSTALDVVVGGWQLAGINTITPGEMVTFTYTPATRRSRCRRSPTTSRARTTTGPNITCDPYAADPQSITQWFNPSCVVVPTDPSQPFGNAPRNNVRGPNFWQFDLAATKNVAPRRPGAAAVARSRRSICSTA